MIGYLLKRLLSAGLVLIAVSMLVFALLNVIPGDVAQTLAGDSASQEQIAAKRRELGLDRPLPVRYLEFAQGVVQGDLGKSAISGRPVSQLLMERFAATVNLALAALVVAIFFGLLAGTIAAVRAGGYVDLLVMMFTTLGESLPSFWFSLLLIQFFALHLGWLPVLGAGTLAHLVLPAISLALPAIALIARMVRGCLLDVKSADFVRTAHAKGLSQLAVWREHIFRNAILPVITMLGLYLGNLLGGAFIIETIFAWPGLGRLVVQAIFDRDFPVVIGAVLFIALIYQVLNILVDLAHAWLDPRVGTEAM
ncbi:peptide ABC transporter, permease protein [Oscillochloris trichoides DG-6]|uniref:Peptide ABC transporter, permease protein n=1 Tax=Oscillochloris trichoides DG-6 TaxID=765420 RepID=E1IES0_9CHLR|nr:ABC transporter permease [Oscillochloris trichoides]EFO80319.1 peptide ABC transporter, permease protein [Oscillochloris trichoides DG-6]